MKTQIGLHFGALAEGVASQLKQQKFKYDSKEVEHFQMCVNALLRLRFADLITDQQHEKIQMRLYRKIVSHVCKVNKLKVKDIQQR